MFENKRKYLAQRFKEQEWAMNRKLEKVNAIIEKFIEDNTCAICMEIYVDPITLECGHSFCKLCLYKIIHLSVINKCSICRSVNFHSVATLKESKSIVANTKLFLETINYLICDYEIKKDKDTMTKIEMLEHRINNTKKTIEDKNIIDIVTKTYKENLSSFI